MVKQWVEVPESASEDRTQQWTLEHIVGIPVPQVVEELVEVPKDFAQDRLRQRSEEQTIETPDISLKEKIVEKPVIQMQGNTQQIVNIRAEHVVNTVEAEVPHSQFIDKAVEILVAQRQISMVQIVQKSIEIPVAIL